MNSQVDPDRRVERAREEGLHRGLLLTKIVKDVNLASRGQWAGRKEASSPTFMCALAVSREAASVTFSPLGATPPTGLRVLSHRPSQARLPCHCPTTRSTFRALHDQSPPEVRPCMKQIRNPSHYGTEVHSSAFTASHLARMRRSFSVALCPHPACSLLRCDSPSLPFTLLG